MRQLLYKSGLLCTIFFLVSIMINLSVAAIVKSKEPKKILSALSNNYYMVESNDSLSLENYNSYFHKEIHGIIIETKIIAMEGNAAIAKNLNMVSGTFFTQKDYENNTNTVVIQERLLSLCQKENGKYYYRYNGKTYRVIGVFNDSLGASITNADVIINIYSSHLKNFSQWNMGFLDNCSSVKIKQYKEDNHFSIYKATDNKNSYFNSYGSSLNFLLVIYIGMTIMILLHSFSAIDNWLDGRKKEIAIRKLVGASDAQICQFLIFRFLALLTVIVLAGTMTTQFLLYLNNRFHFSYTLADAIGNRLHISGILFSILFFIILGFCLIGFKLLQVKNTFVVHLIHHKD